MKSQVNAVLHVFQALCKDVFGAYPDLKGFDLDQKRIALTCRTRGLGLFTLDLPHLDSLLLRGLEDGRLMLEGPLSRAVSKRIRVPRLFAGLWLRVFDKESCLKQDPDITAIFLLRQLCCLGKKIEVNCSPDRIKRAVEKFHHVEANLRRPSLRWDSDRFDVDIRRYQLSLKDAVSAPSSDFPLLDSETLSIEEVNQSKEDLRILDRIQQVADVIVGSWQSFNPILFSEELENDGQGIGFKHGSGAVAERVAQAEKSDWCSWSSKLEGKFPYQYCGKTAGSDSVRPANHELASRLMCVPKTAKSPRLIASESAPQMWCQQLIWNWLQVQLRNSVARHFIDFRDQSKSGDLVLQASLDRSLATVDLSDASDRLTCWTVERLFRLHSSLLDGLHAARTRYIRDEVSDEISFLKLKKFASQGTAATFPVQSLCFLFMALGVTIIGPITPHSIEKCRGRVRVFGDDIIIPKHGYARLCRAMDLLQLKVNASKSYVNGHFRESCGVDGYRGHCVTPVKPKTLIADSPASCQALVDVSNNLFNKGLWNASDSLSSHLPPHLQRGFRIVGYNDAGFAGLTSFSGSDESHLKRRWNRRLHRYEVRVCTLLVRTQQRDRQGFSTLLEFFASKHNPEHARVVSLRRGSQKARIGFLWEPSNSNARISP